MGIELKLEAVNKDGEQFPVKTKLAPLVIEGADGGVFRLAAERRAETLMISMDEIGILLGIAVSLFSLYTSVVKNARETGRIGLMVETLWDFQMRRAQTELVQKGLGVINSPLQISKEAESWMVPLVDPIREFYKTIGRHLSARELYVEIERRFGDRILNEVCIPHGLNQGACLLIAAQAVSNDDKNTAGSQGAPPALS